MFVAKSRLNWVAVIDKPSFAVYTRAQTGSLYLAHSTSPLRPERRRDRHRH